MDPMTITSSGCVKVKQQYLQYESIQQNTSESLSPEEPLKKCIPEIENHTEMPKFVPLTTVATAAHSSPDTCPATDAATKKIISTTTKSLGPLNLASSKSFLEHPSSLSGNVNKRMSRKDCYSSQQNHQRASSKGTQRSLYSHIRSPNDSSRLPLTDKTNKYRQNQHGIRSNIQLEPTNAKKKNNTQHMRSINHSRRDPTNSNNIHGQHRTSTGHVHRSRSPIDRWRRHLIHTGNNDRFQRRRYIDYQRPSTGANNNHIQYRRSSGDNLMRNNSKGQGHRRTSHISRSRSPIITDNYGQVQCRNSTNFQRPPNCANNNRKGQFRTSSSYNHMQYRRSSIDHLMPSNNGQGHRRTSYNNHSRSPIITKSYGLVQRRNSTDYQRPSTGANNNVTGQLRSSIGQRSSCTTDASNSNHMQYRRSSNDHLMPKYRTGQDYRSIGPINNRSRTPITTNHNGQVKRKSPIIDYQQPSTRANKNGKGKLGRSYSGQPSFCATDGNANNKNNIDQNSKSSNDHLMQNDNINGQGHRSTSSINPSQSQQSNCNNGGQDILGEEDDADVLNIHITEDELKLIEQGHRSTSSINPSQSQQSNCNNGGQDILGEEDDADVLNIHITEDELKLIEDS